VNSPVESLWAHTRTAVITTASTSRGVECVDKRFNRLMRRLYPAPDLTVRVEDMYAGVARNRPEQRPWVEVCMVTSVDGSTAVSGRSAALGNETDAEVLRTLRHSADVIIVGSTTARMERYRRPSKPGQRVGVVTATGDVDLSLDVFQSGAGFLITTETAPAHGLEALRCGRGAVDLPGAVALLDAEVVHAEGGPTLNAALLRHDLVDEVNLTLAPTLVGGDAQRLAVGAPESVAPLELIHVCEDQGHLFLRYVRRR